MIQCGIASAVVRSSVCVAGPIEPEDFGSYTFENLWFTDEVEWAKLVSLKVDYMDGSSKTIKNLKLVKVGQVHQDVMAWEDD